LENQFGRLDGTGGGRANFLIALDFWVVYGGAIFQPEQYFIIF
jgi:hypothetical protein